MDKEKISLIEKVIEEIIDEAGTGDADYLVLEASAKMIIKARDEARELKTKLVNYLWED